MVKLVLTAACALSLASSYGIEVPENLSMLRPPKKVSWRPDRTDDDHIGFNSISIRLSANVPKRTVSFRSQLFPDYCASRRAQITFTYKSDVKEAYLYTHFRPMERPLPGRPDRSGWKQQNLSATGGAWREASWIAELPDGDMWGGAFALTVNGGVGSFEAKDVRIVELAPEKTVGRPVTVGGRRLAEIAVLDGAGEVRRIEEGRAARMIRYMLYQNGYDYLPVRTVTDLPDIGPNAILVGRAAERAGFFTDAELKNAKGLTGAGLYRAKGGRLGVTGAVPAGIGYGAFACLRELGIEYLGGTQWRCPKGPSLEIADGFGAVRVPAIAFRCDNDGARFGGMLEMRNRFSTGRAYGDMSPGLKTGRTGPDHSMPRALVTTEEFGDSHPEFFALQKDGKRHGKDTSPWALQYCLSNTELQRVTAERFLEIMRTDPGAIFFLLAPGDGMGSTCCCEKCKAFGSTSDAIVTFANAIARRTKKEFPDKFITTYSYVDTPYAPVGDVKADSNVYVTYCIYPTETWPSQMLWDTPMNRHGFESLAGWRKQCPRLGPVLYPMQCGDWMTLWPGYDFDVTAVRDFAEHRALTSRYFGLWPVHGMGISQAGAFADLRINVLGRLEEDPAYDDRAGTLAFIRDFYGPAEKPMLAYFDLIRAEPKRRDWIQGCEQHLRGFVTKEFAAKAFPLLDAAEAAAKDDPARLVAVRHEKILFLWTYLSDICRARGNVSTAEFPAWAKRYGEFCRICRETGVDYMGACVRTWFNDTAFLDAKFSTDDRWTESELAKGIIADPEKALGCDFPNCQNVTERGVEIPAKGMGGGSYDGASTWMRKDKAGVRVLRRQSSGFGLSFTKLTLAEAPKGPVKLLIRGIDNEKPSPAEMEIAINEKVIYSGRVPWKKDVWSEEPFTVPAGVLHAGDNDVVIRNITADTEKDGACGDRFLATRNYFWGWFLVEKLVFCGVK